jgi:hypothetical protein
MGQKEILEDLLKQSEVLQKDMMDLEQQFSMKKEQLIRIEGAIEVLTVLENETKKNEEKES